MGVKVREKPKDSGVGAFDFEHNALGCIRHPAMESQFRGNAIAEGPESHSLHSALYADRHSDRWRITRDEGRRNWGHTKSGSGNKPTPSLY